MAIKKSSQPIAAEYEDSKWRAEDDMRTLARAKEIENDRKRMVAAQKVAAEKIKEMQSVVDKKPMPVRKK